MTVIIKAVHPSVLYDLVIRRGRGTHGPVTQTVHRQPFIPTVNLEWMNTHTPTHTLHTDGPVWLWEKEVDFSLKNVWNKVRTFLIVWFWPQLQTFNKDSVKLPGPDPPLNSSHYSCWVALMPHLYSFTANNMFHIQFKALLEDAIMKLK